MRKGVGGLLMGVRFGSGKASEDDDATAFEDSSFTTNSESPA